MYAVHGDKTRALKNKVYNVKPEWKTLLVINIFNARKTYKLENKFL